VYGILFVHDKIKYSDSTHYYPGQKLQVIQIRKKQHNSVILFIFVFNLISMYKAILKFCISKSVRWSILEGSNFTSKN